MSEPLFTPYALGYLSLPNRVVMAPMTRSRANYEHVPMPLMAEYYAARADAGLLITEGTAPAPEGAGYTRIPGLWSAEQVTAWRQITDAVHAAGGRIAVQLMHTGRVGHPHNLPPGAELLGVSAVALAGEMHTDEAGPQPYPTPRAMDEAEVEAALESYVQAARNAVDAGFDAVELHGANGYLIDQFLCPTTNQRTDRWGGDAAGRARFALETARRTAEAIGAERVGIRLSPLGVFNGIVPWDGLAEEYRELVTALGKLGLAWLHLVDHSSMGAPPVPAELKQQLREAFGGPLILSGGYDVDRANNELAAGRGELVAFGRPYISNPDLVRRLRERLELAAPDFSTFYTPGPAGYTDYPTLP
jgi:N-ethylmaleimide reductase